MANGIQAPTQLQQIGTALQGLSAGIGGQLPQFQQAQNQKAQLQQQEQERQKAAAQQAEIAKALQQKQQQQQADARMQAIVSDAQAAKKLLDEGNFDGLRKLGVNRLESLQIMGGDPSDTQRLMKLGIAAGNGSKEAEKLLRKELDSTLSLGKAMGLIAPPEIVKGQTDIGKLQSDLQSGLITQEEFTQASEQIFAEDEADAATGQTPIGKLRADLNAGLLTETEFEQEVTRLGETKPVKLTSGERLAAGFAQRMTDANDVIGSLGQQFTGTVSRLTGLAPQGLKSEERQQFDQATRNFINATLRRESGAAINESEFESANIQYIPQPGDGEDVLAQKQRNREVIQQTLSLEAGGALGELQTLLDQPAISIQGKQLSVGTIVTNDKGQQGRVEADGSITIL